MRRLLFALTLIMLFLSCAKDQAEPNVSPIDSEIILQLVSAEQTNINFNNLLNETETMNRFTYEYYYNGSGVGVGDINNDGLPDIYFGGNNVSDRLYLNKGNFQFEDISSSSGIQIREGWTSGINFSDVNADGWLDIYICRSGPSPNEVDRTNLLFINNQNNTFTESAAQYGLAITDHSVQSAFFDYDLDGDLDMYLLNHPPKGFQSKSLVQHIDDVQSGRLKTDAFYENINGKFVEKSKEAGLINFGFRHGIAVGDINHDGYPDLYISSDFDEPDLMMINNGDKSFSNKIDEQIRHISNFSMGNEIADIDNDGLNDIFVVDMTPDDHVRSKLNMASMNPQKFFLMEDRGFHSQYMVNTLQWNRGNGRFSEIAQIAGIAKTDWSWAPLFFDIDLDGDKDLYVTNGIKRDILNNDVRINAQAKMKELNRNLTINELLEMVPSTTVDNMVFENAGGLKFKERTDEWLDESNFNSNGAAYADLDNDGDYDLIVNNVDKPASIYRNQNRNHNYLKIELGGSDSNPFAIGAKVMVQTGSNIQYAEIHNARGYLSSVDHSIIFGLKDENTANLQITWPDGMVSELNDLEANQKIRIDYDSVEKVSGNTSLNKNWLVTRVNPIDLGLDFIHVENDYNDFEKEILLPHRQSQNGPFVAVADINGDGLDDCFIGGASGQKGQIYLQKSNGLFDKKDNSVFSPAAMSEDLGAEFFDADGDGDLDLYVASGGNEWPINDMNYADRLYLNDGDGDFKKSSPIAGSTTSNQKVLVEDIDGDGRSEIFVGGRVLPGKYPYPVDSRLYTITDGQLVDISEKRAPELSQLGMVSDAVFSDYDGDGDKDLLVVGEWMGITVFSNDNGSLIRKEIPSLGNTTGLWFSIGAYDYDGDGDQDYFVGNLGLNAKFKTTGGKEFHVYSKDFDGTGSNDIVLSQKYEGQLVPVRGRECSSEQMPFISEKFGNYQKFAEAGIGDIFGEELNTALHYQADMLKSVILVNNGDGSFEIEDLPFEAQIAPVMDFEFVDLDGKSAKEIVVVGNHYGAEVETVKYDASYGAIFSYDGESFKSIPPKESGFYTSGDSKDVDVIEIGGVLHLIVTNNNGGLDLFRIK